MLPSGKYDSLKIEIGAAKGTNWWCVMFPPLCFIDTNSYYIDFETSQKIKDNLSNEEFALINADKYAQKNIEIKFKIIELLNALKK